MKIISQYTLLLLLFSNIASQFIPLNFISNICFYGALILGIIMLFMGNRNLFSSDKIRSSSFLLFCICIYTVYQLTFGFMNMTSESWLYLFAKVFVLFIIYVGIQENFNFYYEKIIPILSFTIAILIIYGSIFSNEIIQGRVTCGFGNPNSTSAISVIGFAGFLLTYKSPKILYIIGLLICFYGILAGGSRTSFMMCVIALLMKYKISYKTILLFISALFFIIWILPHFGLNTIALTRIIDVFEKGNFTGSREAVRKATWMMIQEHPIIGWGYKSGIQGGASHISKMGSHNGYLDTIKAIGFPFAAILLGYMSFILIKLKVLFFNKEQPTKFHIFLILSILPAALYESYIIGVNQIITNLLFMSIAILEYKRYYLINQDYNDK